MENTPQDATQTQQDATQDWYCVEADGDVVPTVVTADTALAHDSTAGGAVQPATQSAMGFATQHGMDTDSLPQPALPHDSTAGGAVQPATQSVACIERGMDTSILFQPALPHDSTAGGAVQPAGGAVQPATPSPMDMATKLGMNTDSLPEHRTWLVTGTPWVYVGYSLVVHSGMVIASQPAQHAISTYAAAQPDSPTVLQPTSKVPVIEVAFPGGMWWTMPLEAAREILALRTESHRYVMLVWDWGSSRTGSFVRNGNEQTNFNRYELDFDEMLQTNIDNERRRSFRVVWVDPAQLTTPKQTWKGEFPHTPGAGSRSRSRSREGIHG